MKYLLVSFLFTVNAMSAFIAFPVGTGGNPTDLQISYNETADGAINLDATRGSFQIEDNASPIGAALMEVLDNSGATSYFSVDVDGMALESGAKVNAVLDEDAMGSNSATSLATQQSIKAYVDNNVTSNIHKESYLLDDEGSDTSNFGTDTISVKAGGKLRVYLSDSAFGRSTTALGDSGCDTIELAGNALGYDLCSTRGYFGLAKQVLDPYTPGGAITLGACYDNLGNVSPEEAYPVTVNGYALVGASQGSQLVTYQNASFLIDDYCVEYAVWGCKGEVIVEDGDADGSIDLNFAFSTGDAHGGIRCYAHVEELP